jgi:membrane-bound lytic murein transglycosylase A
MTDQSRPLRPLRTTRQGLVAGLLLLVLAACGQEPPLAPATPEPDRLVLTPVAWSELPGWRTDRQDQALSPLRRSCQRLTDLPPGQPVGADGTGGLAADWLGPCGALRSVPEGDAAAVRRYFETWFQPFRVANGTRGTGLFTGYFESELAASRTRHGPYQIPLYTRPKDLPRDPAQPYASRAEIEAGALAATVPALAYVTDAVDAHILQIQGSGRLRLDDGGLIQIGFDGSNGRPYVALGQILLRHGKIGAGDTTMQTIRAWLKDHPAEAPALMAENPRYVFFRIIPGEAPIGSAGVPLTAGRSLAVDPHFIPLGVPLWLSSVDPDGIPLERLVIAQDTGAAIKGPVRGDLFWGAGDAAFDKAGRMKSQGRYFLLLPRTQSRPVALLDGGPW